MARSYKKPTLDKDLDKLGYIEDATSVMGRRMVAPGLALLFVVVSAFVAAGYVTGQAGAAVTVAAVVIGAYMALNIGANDVANNMGPAVGARALSMTSALAIAAVFETAGALIAGGDVVQTISKGIVDPAVVSQANIFIAVMMAALIASALWINLATWLGAPVSTTHAIVGGVMGSGVAAAGFVAVNWATVIGIAASWVISPLLGGVLAAACLAFIKVFIIYRQDKIAAARRFVPMLIGIMAGAFAAYLMMKGLRAIFPVSLSLALLAGLGVGLLCWLAARPVIRRQSRGMENRNQSLRRLFGLPLIFSAALLSFAHGANDVANAVGPLAAIVHTVALGDVAAQVSIPFWVMAVGAFGISFGLVLYGPRLIRMVGEQITRLNPMRAYCVALSAAVTVILASALGLPVSSTHITVGAVFGVGFFREWYTDRSRRRADYVNRKNGKKGRALRPMRDREEQKRRRLVRRAHFMTIAAAWVVTVPVSALLAGAIFFALRTIL